MRLLAKRCPIKANVMPRNRRQLAVHAMGPPSDLKVALITGSNIGIGFETAKALSSAGYYVVLGCRDTEKANAAKAKLETIVPNAPGFEVKEIDLANLDSIRTFANKALDFGHPISVLVNNAGVMAPPLLRTKDGFELQIGVNHLGHFLLTNLLLPLIVSDTRESRIVNVSSAAHLFGHINFDDLQSEKSFDTWKAYGQSKLANVLFSYELARRLPPPTSSAGTTVNALHPGVVATELSRYMMPDNPNVFQKAAMMVAKNFVLTPEQGAETSIYAASSQEMAGVTGKYLDKCKPVVSSKESYDVKVAKKLWDLSAELTGLTP